MHDDDPKRDITEVLRECREDDSEAFDRLVPLVYGELRRLANHYYMQNERSDHTLQPTALVHEAYARLVGAEIEWESRAHFFRAAGRAMRRVLVDHARARGSAKRGGGQARVSLDDVNIGQQERPPDVIELDDALEGLAKHHPRPAKVVELQFFVGIGHEEIARVLDISPATVNRDSTFARAWLHEALSER